MKARNASHQALINTQKLPAGLAIFSQIIKFKAPYFSSIPARFVDLRPGYGRATMKKRRKVTNHLGTVHAIAMANLCEFVGGTLMEISVSRSMRWIPKGMDIRYLARAKSDVTAICEIDDIDWSEKQDVALDINVFDVDQVKVATAVIPMYVSPR